MLVLVHHDNHIQGDARLTEYAEEIVRGSIERFGDRVTRVEVQLSDENSRDKAGGNDKRCVLEVRLAGLQPMSVSHDADSVKESLHGAVEKLEKLVDHTLGKQTDSKRRTSAAGEEAEV